MTQPEHSAITATMGTPDRLAHLAVIVVNYGTADLAIKAVQSVLDHEHGGRHVDVYLVDNASPDDSADRFREAHAAGSWGAQVHLRLEDKNHGFGRGNNVVLRDLAQQASPPDAVLLLNPDAYLDNEVLDILAQVLENDPKAGFAGAGIAKPDGTLVTGAFRFPSVMGEFVGRLSFGPVARLLERWSVPLPPDTPAGPVDWVSGASVMARMSMLNDLDFFEPAYFLYYEEVDLIRRGADAGWICRYAPTARVIHLEGASTGVKSNRGRPVRIPAYLYESWRIYFCKRHGRFVASLAGIASLLGAAGNRTICALRGRTSSIPLHFFSDFWRYALRPVLWKPANK